MASRTHHKGVEEEGLSGFEIEAPDKCFSIEIGCHNLFVYDL